MSDDNQSIKTITQLPRMRCDQDKANFYISHFFIPLSFPSKSNTTTTTILSNHSKCAPFPSPIPSSISPSSANAHKFNTFCPSIKTPFCPKPLSSSNLSRRTLICSKSSETELSATDEEWYKKLREKKKPLYSHNLPCIEAWLKKLGFYQSRENRAVWLIEKPDWYAQLSLDFTDLCSLYKVSKKWSWESWESWMWREGSVMHLAEKT